MPPHGHGGHFDDEDYAGRVIDRKMIRRLLKYVIPHKKLVFIAIVCMFLSAGVELLIPYVTKVGIDNYLAKLYQIYTPEPAAEYELLTDGDADPTDFIPIAPGNLLVRKKAIDEMGPAERYDFMSSGKLDSLTFYCFDAADFAQGDPGDTLAGCWLVPEQDLSKISPLVLTNIRSGDLHGIKILALFLGGLILVSVIAGYGHAISLAIAGQRSMYDVRMELFEHIQGLSMNFFSRNPIGRLVTRVTNDIEALNEMFTAVLVNLIKDIVLFAGTAVILFFLNVRLALISLAVSPFFIIITVIFRIKARNAYRLVRKYLSQLNSNLAEDLNGVKIVQIFRQEKRRRKEYMKTNSSYFDANMKQLVIFGIFRPLIEIIASAGVALVLIYGGGDVLSNSLTIGALVAFISYVRQMFRPLADISSKFNIMQSAMAASERVFGIMDTKPEITDGIGQGSNKKVEGEVEFEKVTFSYIEDTVVLRSVSFNVEPGKSIALVGPTGAGKTSVISLLCRFYDVDSGKIMLDGQDIREMPVSVLRENISIVLQDAFIFSRSIEDNIRLGQNLSEEDVRKAADLVQATPFIEKLPDGFRTIMAERGATLSTGQKQLICFARALAHNPKILVLDEATSNVDPATEQLIQNAIGILMQNRTSIIVAHRLSTIQKADQILVIDDGRILERGTHQELLAKRRIYYNLYLLQFGDTP